MIGETMRKKLWQVLAAVGLLTILAGGALAYLGDEAHIMNLKAEAPARVLAGQPFDVWITLENTSATEQEIVSLGVQDNVEVVEMVPNYRTIEQNTPWREYVFARQRRPLLLAGETIQIRLRLIAPKGGDIQTEVAIWYNNQIRSDYVVLNYTVVPHPAPWLGR